MSALTFFFDLSVIPLRLFFFGTNQRSVNAYLDSISNIFEEGHKYYSGGLLNLQMLFPFPPTEFIYFLQ